MDTYIHAWILPDIGSWAYLKAPIKDRKKGDIGNLLVKVIHIGMLLTTKM